MQANLSNPEILQFITKEGVPIERVVKCSIQYADALIEELKKGKKGTETQTIKLTNKIPVFIIYCPVHIVSGKLVFLDDIYGLIK